MRFHVLTGYGVVVAILLSSFVHAQTIDLNAVPDSLELFAPGIISTGMYERDIAISPDGNEIIYTLGDYAQTRRCLVSLRKTGAGWGDKEILPFSGVYQDIEPAWTPDGTMLFFASTRPLPGDSARNDYNIWKVGMTSNGWEIPFRSAPRSIQQATNIIPH